MIRGTKLYHSPDSDVPPNSEGERDGDADGMEQLREMHVEEDEHRPPVRKYLPLWEHDVHVNSERYVFQHDEHVGGRETRENSVYGSCDHIFPR